MAAGRRCRSQGRGKVGSPGICRHQVQIHGRKLGGGSGTGNAGYDRGSSKLGARGDRNEEGGGCLLVRGRRIRRAGLRINKKGEVCAPDSEEEGSDPEVENAAMEGLLPCWFPRRSLMPWRPRRGCCRGGSRGGASCRGGSTKKQQQRQTTRHLEDGTRVAGPQQGNMQSHTSICVSGEAARAERRESQQLQSKTPVATQSASQGAAIFRRRGQAGPAPPPSRLLF
ncbi:hypothetical protein PVAP13_4NG225022 [Panicum virgatum]|uniref:Uncharacterized protein n=1 Tax=Panicum virgatum TaxID=38727 RepID=A0A8T0TAW4_PANVG|nr:hypothetical protein PVAP13_4NG225022 [Panicum virgatum]